MSGDRAIACAYCGLPVSAAGRPRAAGSAGADRPLFCCFGCLFAAAVAQEQGPAAQARWAMTRLGLAVFLTMNVMGFSLALWSQGVYDVRDAGPSAKVLQEVFLYLCMVCALPVILLLAGPLLEYAVIALGEGRITSELMIVVGVVAAYLYSVVSVIRGQGHVYFDVGSMVLVAVTLGRWLEATVRLKTSESLSRLERLLPQTVRVAGQRVGSQPTSEHGWPSSLRSGTATLAAVSESSPLHPIRRATVASVANGERLAQRRQNEGGPALMDSARDLVYQWWDAPRSIPLDQVRAGQIVQVLAGERIALDGVIVAGMALVDERLISGEWEPVTRKTGDTVCTGGLNLDGRLLIEVTAPANEGTLQRLVDAVRAAACAKGRYQRLADRIAQWLTPAVTAVALAALVVHGTRQGWDQGLLAALSVLLIACPCALGLATPLATWSALGTASSAGVIFRNGDAIVRLSQVRALCLDKTGTLSTGESVVSDFVCDGDTPRHEALRRAEAMAAHSTHLLAAAVARFSHSERPSGAVPPPTDVRTHPGRGIAACIANEENPTYLGSPRWMNELHCSLSDTLTQTIATANQEGQPTTCIAWDGKVRAVFVFAEQLRPDVEAAINMLRNQKIQLLVLTGDQSARGAAWQKRLDVTVRAGLLPEQKQAAVLAMKQQGLMVGMVGDGVNDAPALAVADIGIAMGCGSDVSRDAADVCLMTSQLGRLPWTIDLARKTARVVRGNLLWAFAYNSIGIALAAAGKLNPIVAALTMVGSSIYVISNSLRLARIP